MPVSGLGVEDGYSGILVDDPDGLADSWPHTPNVWWFAGLPVEALWRIQRISEVSEGNFVCNERSPCRTNADGAAANFTSMRGWNRRCAVSPRASPASTPKSYRFTGRDRNSA